LRERDKTIRGEKARRITSYIVFVTLVFSVAYSIFHIVTAPSETAAAAQGVKLKSDYTLMLIQCLLGLAVMMLPSVIERRWKITIPSYMHICYVVFLYAGIYLGEVRNFYYTVPHWDTILHTFSGAMLGAVGYSIVETLNSQEKIKVNMSTGFVALFAFCFALAMGVLWEIYEFSVDQILSLNMQKYATENGLPKIGSEALLDTMKDLIVDSVGAFAFTIFMYVEKKSEKKIFLRRKK